MDDHERKNDYLTVDDLIWALGLGPRPGRAAPGKDDSGDADVDSDEPAPAPDEADSTEAVLSEAASDENEEPTSKETILGFHMKDRSANEKEATSEPLGDITGDVANSIANDIADDITDDITKPIARILDSIPVLAAAKNDPSPLPSYIDPSAQLQSAPLDDAAARLYEDLWGGAHPTEAPSDDVAATLPSQRQRVYISTPNHQPVTAKKAAWTVLERPTRTTANSQLATAYDPTAEMPPIRFSEKQRSPEEPKDAKAEDTPDWFSDLEVPRWLDGREERAKQDQHKNLEGSAGAGKPDGAEKPASSDKPDDVKEPPSNDKPAAQAAQAAQNEPEPPKPSNSPNAPSAPNAQNAPKPSNSPNSPNAPKPPNTSSSEKGAKKPPSPHAYSWMLVAAAILCTIANLSLVMAFVVMGA